MDKKTVFKMAKSIAKELCANNIRLTRIQQYQLKAVLNDQLPSWVLMTHEKAYEDIYKTLRALIELWRSKEL